MKRRFSWLTVVLSAALFWAGCSGGCAKSPMPVAPVPPPPPVVSGQKVPPVPFGSGLGPARFRESWGSKLVLPLVTDRGGQPEQTQFLTVERGSAVVELAGDGGTFSTATVRFDRIEKIEGPVAAPQTTTEADSNTTFTVDATKSEAQVIVRASDKKVLSGAETHRVRERIIDAFDGDAFTLALRKTPVAGGELREDLSAAFVTSFVARDATRGGPPLVANSAAVRLKAIQDTRAIFEVGVIFSETDESMTMKSKLDGEVVVDIPTARLIRMDLTGPVSLTTRGQAEGTTNGEWSEQLIREPVRE